MGKQPGPHMRNRASHLARVGLVALAATIALASLAPAVLAEEPSAAELEATGLAHEAERLLETSDYRAAGFKYAEAYRKFPHHQLLFNAARSFQLSGDLSLSATYYRKYLTLDSGEPELRERAKAYLLEFKAAGVPEPEPEPPAPPPPDPAPPEPPQPVEQAGAPPPSSVAGTPAESEHGLASHGPSAWGFVLFGVGAAAVGTAIGLRLRASGLRSDIANAQKEAVDGVVPPEVMTQATAAKKREQALRADRWSTVTNVVGGVTLVGAIVTLLVTRGQPRTRSSVHVTVAPAPSGTTMMLGGSF